MQKIATTSLLHSLGVVVYVALVGSFMNNAEKIIPDGDTVLTAMAFLLLFTTSAAIVGSLVFGYPVVRFLNGQKREGVLAALFTIGWLVVELLIVFSILYIQRS